jgi:hypothetical protein
VSARAWALLAGSLLAAGAAGYGLGRYATPAKTVKVETVRVETKVEWRDREIERVVAGPTRSVTVTRSVPSVCPGLPEVTTTTTVDAGPVVVDRASDGSGTTAISLASQTATTVTAEQPRWLLQAGVASGTNIRPAYSVGASYRLAGPFWLGSAWHITDRRAELRAGFTF